MRMEEMMMRLLTGNALPVRTNKMEEIENNIETLRITQQAAERKEMREGTQLQQKTNENA